jgi:hypothetical protein
MPTPTTRVTNSDRADWAALGLRAFASRTGQRQEFDAGADGMEQVISSFLADLMHHCAMNGIDFDAMVALGRVRYETDLRTNGIGSHDASVG